MKTLDLYEALQQLDTAEALSEARGRLLVEAEAERNALRLRVAELEGVNEGLRAGARAAMRVIAREANKACDSIESRMRAAGISVVRDG